MKTEDPLEATQDVMGASRIWPDVLTVLLTVVLVGIALGCGIKVIFG
ncbi:MAG: hypothetical protein KOO63_06090 [Bacteroidales bacterium]|nr:hypothetical protein [Candidatus Latescibacterota bacterium]